MYLYNVVLYDGVNSWVNKFVLKGKSAKKDIDNYLKNTDAEAVKLDKLFSVTLENVISYKTEGDAEHISIFERFLKMYN
jgi:hypothetical protein